MKVPPARETENMFWSSSRKVWNSEVFASGMREKQDSRSSTSIALPFDAETMEGQSSSQSSEDLKG